MPFTTIINDMDWAISTGPLVEIAEALRERQQINSGAPITPIPIVGDDVQGASLWQSWQQACENLVDSGKWCEDKNHHGEATIPALTWETLKIVAGISSGFRRATSLPADWTDYSDAAFVATGYGTAQIGDIIGPWLLVDLQNVLKELVATRHSRYGGRAPADDFWTGAHGSEPVCQDAKDGAEADWATDAAPSGGVTYSRILLSGGNFSAYLAKGKEGAQTAAIWAGMDRSCDWYVFPASFGAGVTDVFDANGEQLIDDKWSLWAGEGEPEDTPSPLSPWVPLADVDDPLPVWVDPCPVDPGFHYRGWRVNQYVTRPFFLVVRWNVLGGLEYQ